MHVPASRSRAPLSDLAILSFFSPSQPLQTPSIACWRHHLPFHYHYFFSSQLSSLLLLFRLFIRTGTYIITPVSIGSTAFIHSFSSAQPPNLLLRRLRVTEYTV